MPVDGKPHYRLTQDGLVNLVSGMGTTRDKGAMSRYTMPMMSDMEAVTAYKASALVRRAIDLPAEDAAREWREWQAEAEQITAIEAEEKRLGLQGKMMRAMKMARLTGGAAVLIGNGDLDITMPIIPEALKNGGIKYLTVLTTQDITAGDLEYDPSLAEYNKPTCWYLRGGIRVHPSRVVILTGQEPVEGFGLQQNKGFGDSELMGAMDALMRVEEAASNASSLMFEAKVDVFKIPGLMENLSRRGDAYSNEVIRRLTLAATGKGISGALVMDASEEYEQKSASFAGLPDLLDRFCQLASAVTGIPMTLLFGMSPGGMNATGDADTRGYYDRVKVIQALELTPAMQILDECLIWSALGSRPPEVHYNWRSLWQPTARDRADLGFKLVQTLEKLNAMGVLPSEAIGETAVNALTESGVFPGLEAAVEGQDDALGEDDGM